MEYKKIELIKEWMVQYYSVYQLTLDTDRFVDSKMNDKILEKIFKFQKKDFKKLIKEAKRYEKDLLNEQRLSSLEFKKKVKKEKLSLLAKIKIYKRNRALKKRLWGFRKKRMLGETVDYSK